MNLGFTELFDRLFKQTKSVMDEVTDAIEQHAITATNTSTPTPTQIKYY
jgi:3-hydroxyacyl-CoA dehydrogenase